MPFDLNVRIRLTRKQSQLPASWAPKKAADNEVYSTTEILHHHKLKSDSKDYKSKQRRVFYLPSLYIVLRGRRVAERGYSWFYTEDLFPSIFDAQEPAW
jgi:hypothetical protein